MISKPKKLVYGLVLAGGLGTLVTQLLARSDAPTRPPPLDLPAEGAPAAPASSETASESPIASPSSPVVSLTGDGAVAVSEPSTSASVADASEDSGPVGGSLGKLERALGTLRNFQPSTLHPALDQLAQPASSSSTAVLEQPPANAQVALPALESPHPVHLERTSRSAPFEQLRALLADQPLCGILHGASGSAAMFGGRIVRVGDQLLPGDAVVRAIDAKGVLVAFQGEDMRIELPPFRPRPSLRPSEELSKSDVPPSAATDQGSGSSAGAAAPAKATETVPNKPEDVSDGDL